MRPNDEVHFNTSNFPSNRPLRIFPLSMCSLCCAGCSELLSVFWRTLKEILLCNRPISTVLLCSLRSSRHAHSHQQQQQQQRAVAGSDRAVPTPQFALSSPDLTSGRAETRAARLQYYLTLLPTTTRTNSKPYLQ